MMAPKDGALVVVMEGLTAWRLASIDGRVMGVLGAAAAEDLQERC